MKCCILIIILINVFLSNACNKELLNNIQLKGVDSSVNLNLLTICPSVESSCCSIKDQLLLIDQYEVFEIKFNNKRNIYINLYKELFDSLGEFNNYVLEIYNNKIKDKHSNCNKLARILLKYNIEKIFPKILNKIEDFFEFNKAVNKGYYCAVCDSNAHKFFNFKNNSVLNSTMFCSKILKHAFLYYNYTIKLIPKYIELALKFINTCDNNGELQLNSVVSTPLVTFNSDIVNEDNISICLKALNYDNWFESCEFLCKKVKVFGLFNDLLGDYKKIKESTVIINYVVKNNFNKYKYTQVLDNIGYTVKEKNITDSNIFYDFDLFNYTNSKILSFSNLANDFSTEEGLEPYFLGKISFINEKARSIIKRNIEDFVKIEGNFIKNGNEVIPYNKTENLLAFNNDSSTSIVLLISIIITLII